MAQTVNFVRDLVNTPPNEIYPEKLAEIAKEVAKALKELNVVTREEFEELKLRLEKLESELKELKEKLSKGTD